MDKLLIIIFSYFFILFLFQLCKVSFDAIKPLLWSLSFGQLILELGLDFFVNTIIFVYDRKLIRDFVWLADEEFGEAVDVFALKMGRHKVLWVNLFKSGFPIARNFMLLSDSVLDLGQVSLDDGNFFNFCAELSISYIDKFLFLLFNVFVSSANFKKNGYDFDPFLVFFFLGVGDKQSFFLGFLELPIFDDLLTFFRVDRAGDLEQVIVLLI